MACPKYAEWLSVDGAGLFRRKTICKYINCEHIWNNSKSSTVADVACMKCSSEGKEAFDFNESEVSVRFYTSMLAGKVSKSADNYTLQVQHLRVKMWSKVRRNPKFQCRAHFRCFDSLQFAVLWSSPFLPFLCTFLAILCHLHISFKLILCIGCILVPIFLWIILYMNVDVRENVPVIQYSLTFCTWCVWFWSWVTPVCRDVDLIWFTFLAVAPILVAPYKMDKKHTKQRIDV